MKNLILLAGIATLVVLSCSPVKVTNRYAVPDIAQARNNNFVVIVRSSDADVRNVYEEKMANALKSSGINASPLTGLLPILDPNNKISEAEVTSFVNDLKSKNFNGVLVTVLKNVNKQQNTYQTGGNYYDMYPGYFYGFNSFYYNPWAYSDWGPTSYTTDSYNVYQVQTNVYDLTREPRKQLIAVVSSEITDPDNFVSLADDFANKVVKTLESK